MALGLHDGFDCFIIYKPQGCWQHHHIGLLHDDVCMLFPKSYQCKPHKAVLGWDGLTHWGRVMHICVNKLSIIGSDNGLSPQRRQAIIWTNAGILLIGPLGTNFSENLIKIQTFSLKANMFENVVCEMLFISSRPQSVKCVQTVVYVYNCCDVRASKRVL